MTKRHGKGRGDNPLQRGFSGAAVEILVDRQGRVFFLDLPPDFVPVARALDPKAAPQPDRQEPVTAEEAALPPRTRSDAKR